MARELLYAAFMIPSAVAAIGFSALFLGTLVIIAYFEQRSQARHGH